MKKIDEPSQIFYEISMSIGMSLDLSRMLRDVALVTLRKLNATACVIFMQRQDEDQHHFERVFITPRGLLKSVEYAALEQNLPRSFNSQEFDSFYAKLPMEMALEGGRYLHVMSLPGYGLIALFRARGFLPENVIYSFASLNKKLAVACQACQSHENLEELLKNRTVELEEKRITEQALRESESRFRDLVENTSDWIWETNTEGEYTYASPAVEDILGYKPKSILGKTPFELMDKEEAKRVELQFSQAVESRTAIVALENANCHKDGNTVILETSGVPIIDADGVFKGFRGVDRDITVRKETHNRLKKSEELYRGVYSTAPLAFIVWDKDCRILEWNDLAATLFGYNLEEVEGKNFFDLIIPELEKETIEHVVENLLKGRIDKNIIHQNITKNGDLIWCEWNNSILRDENGEITGAMSLGLDITERINMENKLKESERTYREIFNGSNDVLFVHDIETGAVVDVNSKVTELYGYKPAELIGKTVDSLSKGIPPYTIVEASKWIKKSIEEGPQIFEWMALSKKNEAFWVEVSLKKGLIAGKDRLMAVVRDIRERKAAEQELKEYREHLEELVEQRTAEIEAKNKELETFTYSVSHDLKAPLRGIDGYSRLLVEEYSDKLDEEGLLFLSNVRQSATQMNQLIEDLLAYSRMERRQLQPVPIELGPMIDMMISQRTHDIEEGSIRISVNLPFETMTSDMETLRQVLGNYLDNAIKFSKKDASGRVEIGGQEDPLSWTLWVKDNGIGFDPQYHDRIFDIFQRLHRSEDFPGTGVGLAIVRKAVERIGGRVWAESETGKGAVFFIKIPK